MAYMHRVASGEAERLRNPTLTYGKLVGLLMQPRLSTGLWPRKYREAEL